MIASLRRQHGAALLAMLLVLMLGGLWYLTTQLSAASGNFVTAERERNARVLAQAKQALLGYVAQESAGSSEANPGAFPCPEASGNIGTANEGVAASNCTLPAVGRLPWKTLGIDALLDARGEPLWYVVANGWAKPSAAANTVINSNCSTDSTGWASPMTCWSGQLSVDGQANAAVALIIAPGAAMNVQASAGCAARNQTRVAPAPTINYLDYVECSNTAASAFATVGPSASFNDQVLKVTAAEALPYIEAAAVDRFQHQIAPQMRSAYSGGTWPTAAGGLLPFAATFGNPTTSDFKGVATKFQGLMPLSYSETTPGSGTPCTPSSDARCDPMFVAWTGSPTVTRTGGALLVPDPSTCIVTTVTVNPSPLTQTTRIDCTLFALSAINTNLDFNLQATATKVGMTLRQFNTATAMTGVSAAGRTASGVINLDGTAAVTLNASSPSGTLVGLPNCDPLGLSPLLCFQYTISVPISLLADHTLLDSTTASPTGWFLRNRWHEVSYYALAPNIAPSGTRSCTTSATCLQVTYHPSIGKQRGLVVFAGPKLLAQVRPGSLITDFLEGANSVANTADPATFALRSPPLVVNRAFNDHVGVIDANP